MSALHAIPTRAGTIARVLTSVAATCDGSVYVQADRGRWSSTTAVGDATVYEDVRARGTIVARPGGGYWVVDADGGVHARGGAPALDDCACSRSDPATSELIAAAATPTGLGLIALGDDGAVWGAGDAFLCGDAHGRPISPAAIAATPSGRGYYIAGAAGEVLCFGDATFHGEGTRERKVVGIAVSRAPDGYWLACLEGDVLPFGEARPLGRPSRGDCRSALIGFAATLDGRGYVWVHANGRVGNSR